MTLVRIRKATPLAGRRLRLHLNDGRVVERDVAPLITGPVFDEVRDSDEIFRAVRVEGGTVVWPNGADICPDVVIWGGPPPDDRPHTSTTADETRDRSAAQNLIDRFTRAQSWLSAAAALPEGQLQETFVTLFIAFNAMYGRRQYEGDRSQTAQDLDSFSDKLGVMHEADLDEGRATLTNALFWLAPRFARSPRMSSFATHTGGVRCATRCSYEGLRRSIRPPNGASSWKGYGGRFCEWLWTASSFCEIRYSTAVSRMVPSHGEGNRLNRGSRS